jgi:hypothetical protein
VTARTNRSVLIVLGVFLLAGGGLSAAYGGGAFGAARSHRTIFDGTVIRWWNEGGWESFAVVVAIGVVLLAIGAWLAVGQLRRASGGNRTPDVTFPATGRGETTLRSSALATRVGRDLERIADVSKARVHLHGTYPTIELRAALTVGDEIDLDTLPDRVDDALSRLTETTGIVPDPVHVTLRFSADDRDRQLA